MLTNISFTPVFTYPDSGQLKSKVSQLSYCTCNHNWQHYNQNCYTRYGIQQPKELAMATAKRHCEFIAGRYCASQAIKNLAQPPNSTSETQILIQPDRSPLWPQSIVGSISHSGKRAVAVAGNAQRYSGLGIDCESLLTESLAAEITDLVLHPLDRGLLLNRPSQQELNRGFLVTLAFSAKESLFKALSPSVTNIKGFHDFSIRHISGEELILSPTKKLSSSLSTATEFRVSYVKQADFIVTMAIITVKN